MSQQMRLLIRRSQRYYTVCMEIFKKNEKNKLLLFLLLKMRGKV